MSTTTIMQIKPFRDFVREARSVNEDVAAVSTGAGMAGLGNDPPGRKQVLGNMQRRKRMPTSNKKLVTENDDNGKKYAIATRTSKGWRRVPDTKFDTEHSATRYGDKYHMTKDGSRLYKVVTHPDSFKKLVTENKLDGSITLSIPVLIRALEITREMIKTDDELHVFVEKLMDLDVSGALTMDDVKKVFSQYKD